VLVRSRIRRIAVYQTSRSIQGVLPNAP